MGAKRLPFFLQQNVTLLRLMLAGHFAAQAVKSLPVRSTKK
ncbi:hypothetical protein GPEL0_01f1570 [Geoanaerobacter pelophilus]|uniref:Uncharacterized protein n=1 Tax=Geoanaerobacter pelophilus TaxID=60036 RepID=A0ABQ0MGV2_9BACT|nr:hypothetical protein GPEL0_01f1570 [Geoanaerobacter pelophilus]